MIPKLYTKDKVLIGELTECSRAIAIEERNGMCEIEIDYQLFSPHWDKLVRGNIIEADLNDKITKQLFRIYKVTKDIMGHFTVYARHISFDLQRDYIDSVNIENQSCEYCLNSLFRASQFSQAFKGYSDIVNAQNYKINNVNLLKAIAGEKGSILDTFGTGAEIKRDNYDFYVLNKRGHDNGVVIEYASNLTGLDYEEDEEGLITRIRATAKYKTENEEETIIYTYVDSESIHNYETPFISEIDFSDKFEEDEIPTIEKLTTLAQQYYRDNKCDIMKFNYEIEFLPLSKCAGYEDIQDQIELCDTVTIIDYRYNLNTKAKVIKTTYDLLKERYESMEVGNPKTSLGDIFSSEDTKGDKGDTGPQGPPGADGSIGDFPDSLPATPILSAKLLGFASIELNWTYENKVYYNYEIYASKDKGFTPNSFNLIHAGQTSSYLYQAKPNETWYFRACAVNSHGRRTEFSSEIQVVTLLAENMENYFTSAAIGNAVVGSLTSDYMTAGVIKGDWIDAKNLSVTDSNGKRTLDIDSFGNVSLDVSNLKIKNSNISDVYATKSSLEQTSEDFTFKIRQSGGGNLLKNTKFRNGTANWYLWSWDESNLNKKDLWLKEPYTSWNYHKDRALECYSQVITAGGVIRTGFGSDIIPIEANTTYTFSAYMTSHRTNGVMMEIYDDRDGNLSYRNDQTSWFTLKEGTEFDKGYESWSRVTHTFTTNPNAKNIRIRFFMDNHYGGSDKNASMWLALPVLVEGSISPSVWVPHESELYDGIVKIDDRGLSVQQGNNSTNLNSSALNFYNGDILYSRIRGGQFSFTDIQGNQVGWIGRNTWAGSGNYLNAINAEYDHCVGLGAKYSSTATVYTAPFWIASHDGNLTSSSVYSKQGINISDSWTHGAARFKGGNAGTDQKLRIYIGSSTNRGIISAASSVSLGLDVGNVFVSVADSSQTNGVYTNCYSPINMNGYAITNARSISTLTTQTDYTSSLVQKGNNDFFIYNNMSYDEGEIRWCWKEPVFTYAEADVDSETDKWVYSGRNICYIELPIFMAENIEENYHINISKISWGDYRIIEKTPYYFILESKEEDFSFTFEVVGKLIDSETTSANVVVANNYITTDNTVEEPYDTIGLEMP